jgi:hypothetical protein
MWWMDGRSPFNQTHPVTISDSIHLQVNSAGGLLEIHWDPTSAVATTSRSGFLTIRDGSHRKEVHLDSADIRSGHIYYGSKTADVGIRLELARENGGTDSESIGVAGPPAAVPPTDR